MQQFTRLSAVMAVCITVACAEEVAAPHPDGLDRESPAWSEASIDVAVIDIPFATMATATDWGPQDGTFDEFTEPNLGSVNNNGYTSFRTAMVFDISQIPVGAELRAATLTTQLSIYEGVRSIQIHAFGDDGTVQLGDFSVNALVTTVVSGPTWEEFAVDVTEAVARALADGADFLMIGVREEPANAPNYTVMWLGPRQMLSLRIIEPSAHEVAIDIRPGSSDACVNAGTKGVLPVAIMSSTAFDAMTVDPMTVTLSGAGPRTDGQGRPLTAHDDVDGDGLLDLVLHVEVRDISLAIGDATATLVGVTFDGTPIHGTAALTTGCGSTVVLDQLSPFASPAPFTISIGSNSAQILAQVVTPGVSGQLVELGLAVGCSSDPPSDMTLEIRAVDAGQPDSTVFLQVRIPNEAVSQAGDWDFRRIDLGDGVTVTEGTPFALVLSSSGTCATLPGLEGDPYTGGDGWFIAAPNRPGVWEPLSLGTNRADLPFQTYVLVHGGQS